MAKKYYITKESEREGKTYKRYKCIEGWSKNKELCWKFNYRTTLDRKKKTALMYREEEILRKAPNDNYPLNAPWTMEYIPAANDNIHRLWIGKGAEKWQGTTDA